MIDRLGDVLFHNLLFFLAASVIPIKWIIVALCKDGDAQWAGMLALPEDLCYVVIGLVLGDVYSAQGSFRKYFKGSLHPTIDIYIIVALLAIGSTVIHLMGQYAISEFKGCRAAWSALRKHQAQPNAGLVGSHQKQTTMNIILLLVRHLVLFSIVYGLELFLACWMVRGVGQVLAT